MATKKQVCATCGKLWKAGMMTAAGKKFCSDACRNGFKKKKNVCEFC